MSFVSVLILLIYLYFAFYDISLSSWYKSALIRAVKTKLAHQAGFGSQPSHLCPCVSQVKYWKNHEDSEGGAQRVVVPGRENHTRLEGMKPDSHYLVEIRGYNSAGYGPASEHLQIHTKKARMLYFKAA